MSELEIINGILMIEFEIIKILGSYFYHHNQIVNNIFLFLKSKDYLKRLKK